VLVTGTLSLITHDYLKSVRLTALRKRTWFKALDKLERGIFNLTIKFVENIKSQVLAGHIVKILEKLRDAAKCAFTRHVESYGFMKLRETAEQALGLGYDATGWIRDLGFAEWFALNNYYNPVGWRSRV
jgi:hypothetical protein